MNSSSLFSFVSVAVLVLVLSACGSADPGSSTSVDGTSPTGITPDGFCAKKCIADDRDACVAFAGRFSDAFLAAFDSCGDDPGCLEPKLDAAPKTERQEKLAADFCARCECESGSFFAKGGPGSAVQSFSDARLDAVERECFADLRPGLACELSFRTCVLPLLQEDLGATLVCRARR